jgi:SET domain-containing protein
MKSIAQISVLVSLSTATMAYSQSYQEQLNAASNTAKQVINREKNIAISSARPDLSDECLALQSAKIADIDISHASESKGLGAFSTQPIKSGTFLGEYSGETMSLSEVNARFWKKREPDVADKSWAESRKRRSQSITGSYIFSLDEETFVCAEDADQSSWTRFMNHAPEETHDCNVRPFMQTTIGGEIHSYPRFFAIRDIDVGEELQYNYGNLFYGEGETTDHERSS